MTTADIIATANRIAPFVDKWADGVEAVAVGRHDEPIITVGIATFRAAFAGREVDVVTMGRAEHYSITLDDIRCRVDAYDVATVPLAARVTL